MGEAKKKKDKFSEKKIMKTIFKDLRLKIEESYTPLLYSIVKIESWHDALSRKGIIPEHKLSADNCLAILKMTGQFYLARWVHEVMTENKKKHPAYITVDEFDVIMRINNYYRQEGCTWDVLVIPESMVFDRNVVQDLSKPLGDYKSFEGVFVPAFYNQEQKVTFKARVEGRC